jgi:hypothetical protein
VSLAFDSVIIAWLENLYVSGTAAVSPALWVFIIPLLKV